MVNCIPAGEPFYPTDHCGVIRINSENIVPKYLALALQIEGEYEKFSLSNRASTQRIKNLSIQIPNMDTQIEVVDLIDNIDKKILNEKAIIDSLSEDVKSKFVEMFEVETFNNNGRMAKLSTFCENLDSQRKPITEHLRVKGDIPYYGASGIVDYVADFIFDEILLLISEDGANLLSRKTPNAFTIKGKSWINNHAHILRFKNLKLQRYVETFVNIADLSEYINKNANPKPTKEKLNSILVPLPKKDLLELFIYYVEETDKLKFI